MLGFSASTQAQGTLSNGVTHHGVISDPRETNYWSFTAVAGDSIVLRMGSFTLNPRIQVFSPSGVLLGTGGSGNGGFTDADLSLRLTNSGTFIVGASAFVGTNQYSLTFAKAPGAFSPAEDGGELVNGWKQTGSLQRGDLDMWSFNANAGDSIVLRLGATNYNPWIRLYAPNGEQVGSVGSGNGTFMDPDLELRATNSGTYIVVVSSITRNPDGPYVLTLARSQADFSVAPGDEGGPITNGWKHTGALERGDLDLWSFTANAGDGIVLRLGSTNYNPWIRLYGPDGVLAGEAFSGNGGFIDPDLEVRATNSGKYTVVAASYPRNGEGPYTLTLALSPEQIFVTPGDEGGPLTNGWKHTGELNLGDLDVWSFTANSGDGIVLRMGATNFNPSIRLYGPDGALMGTAASGNGGIVDVDLARQATNSGKFTVVASRRTITGAGYYTLTLAKSPGEFFVTPGDEGGPITNGWLHAGQLHAGDLDLWRFNANAGDGLYFRIGTTNYNPSLRLYGPNGTLAAQVFNGNGGQYDLELAVQATNSGTFTLVASSYIINGTGPYLLTFAKSPGTVFVAPGDEGGPLKNGWLHTGELRGGDADVWTFEASAGDAVVLRMGSTNYNPRLRLYGPDGEELGVSGSNNGGFQVAELAIRATNSGTFTVVASSVFVNGTGRYTLTLAKTHSEVLTAPGDEGGYLANGVDYDGTIRLGDLDVWNFFAFAGSTITFNLQELADFDGFTPWVRLYGPDGQLLRTVPAASTISFLQPTTNSGAFLVVIGDGSITRRLTGTYRIHLQRGCAPTSAILLDAGETNRFPDQLRLLPVNPGDQAVGFFSVIVGSVMVTNANGSQPAKVGTPVYLYDTIVTGPGARAEIQLCDDTTFVISEEARLLIDKFVYDPNPPPPEFSFFRTLQAVFVYTSGLIGKEHPPEDSIEKPVGCICIRGDASDYINSLDHLLNPGTIIETASPGTLYTAVTVPTSPFTFGFDYAFLQTTGTLTVAFGGIPVFTRSTDPDATPAQVKRVSMLVTNAAVLGLGLTELTFNFDGPVPGLELFLDNVVFPGFPNGDFSGLDANWFSRGHGKTKLTATVWPRCSEYTALDIEAQSQRATLRWPGTATNYVLEATAALGPSATWTAVTNAVNLATNTYSVTVPLNPSERFFRLRLNCQ